MPIEIELWQLLSLLASLPLSVVGIFILFKKLIQAFFVRRGYIKLLFFTQNKMLREDFKKPQSKTISVGDNKSFIFDPKAIFRWGHTPTLAYNEESVDPLNPLENSTRLTPRRLDDVQFNAFNAGKRAMEKQQQMIAIFLMIAMIGAIAAAGMSVMLWQSMGTMEGGIKGAVNAIPDRVIDKLPKSPTSNTTVIS